MSSLDRSMNKIGLGKSAAGATAGMAPGFMVALLSLTLGFALSTAIRTLPAIGADMLIRDLRVTPQGLAALVGVFPLAFAIEDIPILFTIWTFDTVLVLACKTAATIYATVISLRFQA